MELKQNVSTQKHKKVDTHRKQTQKQNIAITVTLFPAFFFRTGPAQCNEESMMN